MMHSVSSYACPRCEQAALYVGYAEGVTLNACAHCGGVWLNARSARKIAEALPKEALLLSERVGTAATRRAELLSDVRCPVCHQKAMRTRVLAAGVEIDVCGPHGTWYDRHELNQIAKAIERSAFRAHPAADAAPSRAAQRKNSIGLEDAVDLGEVLLEGADAAADIAGSADLVEGAGDVVGVIFGAIGALLD